jgi:hypothetical protein
VRDVRSLEILREVPLVEAKFPSVYVVACLDRRGDHLLAIDDVGGVRVHEIVGAEASACSRRQVAPGGARSRAMSRT